MTRMHRLCYLAMLFCAQTHAAVTCVNVGSQVRTQAV